MQRQANDMDYVNAQDKYYWRQNSELENYPRVVV